MDEEKIGYEEPEEFDEEPEDEDYDEFDSVHIGTIRGLSGMPMSGLATLNIEDENGMMKYLHCDNGQTVRSLENAFGNVIGEYHNVKEDGGHVGQEIYYNVDFMGGLEWFIPINEAPEEFVEEYNKNKGKVTLPKFAM